ncbi:metallophosphoesterase [Pseudogemmobacter faecipullorum]|uniref:Metallophosphoesterase n=1 Tax=Pseudogemmobacter faecipullorum TaxID=2755041 RepID=A0ABS8CQW8_9RHOB|nr:metallophosphoesterase [Pseudogemmobacter faecipullorum]MCB5411230.1 metallophosphoesterase [Pseudogemmobacter faecipullorum]
MPHWYTADLHFGHDRIIPNATRPFRDTSHMDAVLIERLWEKVGPEDDLWVLGDFAFGPKAKDEDWLWAVFSQLPAARRHLIVGNHDGPLTQALPWDSVSLIAEIEDKDAAQPVTLCHYPMMTWSHARKGALHLFGHVHGNWRGSANSVNAGVDLWDFYPITIREAAQRAKMMPPHKHWKDVEPRA